MAYSFKPHWSGQSLYVYSLEVSVLPIGFISRVSYADMATHSVTLITITFIIQY